VTCPGIYVSLLCVNRSKLTAKEAHKVQLLKSKPYTMGLQVPSHVDIQYRRKLVYGHIRTYLGELVRDLSPQKESRLLEGHRMPDHGHMLLSLAPNDSVAQVVGCIKGKTALPIARSFSGHKRNFIGHHCWARG
jgi:hypothetical protein